MKSIHATFSLFTPRLLSLIGLVAVLQIACACGSGNIAPISNLIGVSVLPASVTVLPGHNQQLNATVTNSADTAVTWSTTFGTISATGLLNTPPATADATFRVTATSKADRRQSAYALITVRKVLSPLILMPASVTLSTTQGSTRPTSVIVQVTKPGGGTFAFTARSDKSWLTISPLSGVGPAAIEVAMSIAGLTPGPYTGHVILTGPSKSQATATISLIVSSSASQPQADLSWNASKSQNVASYSIYRSTTRGGPYGLEASALSGLTFKDLTVQSGQTYYYVATAVADNGMESSYSAELALPIP